MPTQKLLLDWSIVRIKKKNTTRTQKHVARLVDSECIIFFFYKNIKKQQYAHTKSVARLVDSENCYNFFLQKH